MSSDPRVRTAAKMESRAALSGELEGLEPYERVHRLASLLRDSGNDESRAWAIREAGKLGADACSLAPLFLDLARDSHNGVRTRAIEALGRIGDDSDAVLQTLGRALLDPKGSVADAATRAIAEFGERALPLVRFALRSTAEGAKIAGLRAAGRIGAVALVDDVLPLTAEPSPVGSLAIATISRLDPGDRRVHAACIDHLDAEDHALRQGAANALRSAGDQVVESLQQALSHPRGDVGSFAAILLLDRGVASEEIVSRALAGLDAKLTYVRRRCVEALGRLPVVSLDLESRLARLRIEDPDKLTKKAGRHAQTALAKRRGGSR